MTQLIIVLFIFLMFSNMTKSIFNLVPWLFCLLILLYARERWWMCILIMFSYFIAKKNAKKSDSDEEQL